MLPVEFTRVSPAKMGGLTLVIDPLHGHPTPTAYCLSKREMAAEARRDLAEREWCKTVDLIGCFERGAARAESPGDGYEAAIATWAAVNNIDAAVWTAYPPNFRERTGMEFSVASAIAYLTNLPRAELERTVYYFHKAPPFLQTPLRRPFLASSYLSYS